MIAVFSLAVIMICLFVAMMNQWYITGISFAVLALISMLVGTAKYLKRNYKY